MQHALLSIMRTRSAQLAPYSMCSKPSHTLSPKCPRVPETLTLGSRALVKQGGSWLMLAAASCRLVALLTANVTPSRTGLHSHCGMLCTNTQHLLLIH